MVMIQNGYGTSRFAQVDSTYKLNTRSVSETRAQEASLNGNGFNLQTGIVGLTSGTGSAMLWVKNSERNEVVIDAIIVGIADTGTIDNTPQLDVYINPTTGTIIDNAVAGRKVNRRTGSTSANLPNTLVYKGAEGNTLTDGELFGEFFCNTPRSFFGVDVVLSNGGSVGFVLNTNTSVGTTNVYIALAAHLEPFGGSQ